MVSMLASAVSGLSLIALAGCLCSVFLKGHYRHTNYVSLHKSTGMFKWAGANLTANGDVPLDGVTFS